MRPGHLIVLVTVLAVAVVGFVFVRSKQNAGAAFVTAQRNVQALTVRAVDNALRAAPDPATHARARRARCRPGGGGELHNPWACLLTYAGGKRIAWRVTISASGAFAGSDQRVTLDGTTRSYPGSISGCCIAVP